MFDLKEISDHNIQFIINPDHSISKSYRDGLEKLFLFMVEEFDLMHDVHGYSSKLIKELNDKSFIFLLNEMLDTYTYLYFSFNQKFHNKLKKYGR